MPREPLAGLTRDQQRRLRELLNDYESGALHPPSRYRMRSLPWQYPHLRRARLTSTMTDDEPMATANVWVWEWTDEESGEGEWVETEEEVELRSFLRPEGEEIPERTRVWFAKVGAINEIVVSNCEPDPEEETPP